MRSFNMDWLPVPKISLGYNFWVVFVLISTLVFIPQLKALLMIERRSAWDRVKTVSFFYFVWSAYQSIGKKLSTQAFFRLGEKFGKQFRVKVISQEYVFFNCPVVAEKLLGSREYGHLSKDPKTNNFLNDVIGNGLVTSKGEFWHSNRKLLSKAFTYSALKKHTKVTNKNAQRVVAEMTKIFGNNENGFHQIDTLLQTYSMQIISEIALGLELNQHKDDFTLMFETIKGCLKMGITRIGASLIQIPMLWNLHPASRKYNESVQNFNVVIQRVIARYDEVSGLGEKISKDKENDDSMLALMSTAGFSREVIADEIKTMLAAGYKSTSFTIELFLVMLALYPKYQNECRREVDSIFNNDIKCPNGKLTLETLSEMKNLERCLFETMRMYPPAPIVSRKLETALKIDNELEIPVGTIVGIPIVLLHRCPENFPEPDQFQPDRFLPENCIKRHPYSYLPFSAGSRGCIAMKLAIMEAKTVVAYILRAFEVETSDKIEDVAHIPSITVQLERGYYFRFKKRIDVPASV